MKNISDHFHNVNSEKQDLIYLVIDKQNFNIDFMQMLSGIKKVWKPATYANFRLQKELYLLWNYQYNILKDGPDILSQYFVSLQTHLFGI